LNFLVEIDKKYGTVSGVHSIVFCWGFFVLGWSQELAGSPLMLDCQILYSELIGNLR
jgi:hypothetical protein